VSDKVYIVKLRNKNLIETDWLAPELLGLNKQSVR
jgi:hypothetical protein